MSIIYDALKKIEASSANEKGTKIDAGLKPKSKSYLLVAFTVCLTLFIVNILYSWLSPMKSPPSLTDKKESLSSYAQPLSEETLLGKSVSLEDRIEPPKETPPVFTLSGVFFSGGEAYALINNRIVKKGDKINGATVGEIFLDEVDLEFGGSIIKISNSTK